MPCVSAVQLAVLYVVVAPVINISLSSPGIISVALHGVACVVHQQRYAAEMVGAKIINFVSAAMVHHHRRQSVRSVDVVNSLCNPVCLSDFALAEVQPFLIDIACAVGPLAHHSLAVDAVMNVKPYLAVVVGQAVGFAEGVVLDGLRRARDVVLAVNLCHRVRTPVTVAVLACTVLAPDVAVGGVLYGSCSVEPAVVPQGEACQTVQLVVLERLPLVSHHVGAAGHVASSLVVGVC